MLTMWDAVSWLKDALASRELVEHLTHYYFRDDRLFASDGRIMASVPCDIAPNVTGEGPLLVPGKEFERILRATRPDKGLTVQRLTGGIEVSQGRFKALVPMIDSSTWPYEDYDNAAFVKLPDSFLAGMDALRPFVSDNATHPWATCIQIEKDGLMATNNVVIARAPCELPLEGKHLLPSWGIDFLLSHRDAFVGGWFTNDAAHFEWQNGGRMRTQLINGEFPPRAKALCQPDVTTKSEITEEWREVFNRVALIANGSSIAIHADHLATGGTGRTLRCEDGATTPVPAGGVSWWSEKALSSVMERAEWWTPETWPEPAAWGRTDGSLVGIVAGLREG